MATIKPFRAIHPNPFYADQLVFTKPQVESVSGKTTDPQGLPPLKTLLETGARQRPETPEGQAHAYQDINNNLRELLNSEKLFLDQEPGIYVYEVKHPGYCQTGIWALTDLHDTIKTHELTFADSVRRIKDFRENTGLEGNPILLTYKQDDVINKIISERKISYPDAHYESASGHHHLWKIEDTVTLGEIVAAFTKIDKVYLADGHHRKQSAEDLANEQAKTDGPVFNTISALYMSTAELKIKQYNRVVIPETTIYKDEFFKQLLVHFYLRESFTNKPIQPVENRKMGLYINGVWYHMTAKAHTFAVELSADKLDVEIIQNQILKPVFGISDPGNDKRLIHIGGDMAIVEMESLFRANPNAIGFTLCPMTNEQLIAAADMGINLPPKSTWIDPKIPYGLLIYKHE